MIPNFKFVKRMGANKKFRVSRITKKRVIPAEA